MYLLQMTVRAQSSVGPRSAIIVAVTVAITAAGSRRVAAAV